MPWLLVLYLACGFIYQVVISCASPQFLIQEVTVDDTYLYLEVAYNWAQKGLPTFDGQTLTNGFQPLWGVLLAGVATIVHDKQLFLQIACLLCALLNLATAPLVYTIGKELADRRAGYLAALGWGTYLFFPRSVTGMETPLHGVIFAAGMICAIRAWRRLPDVNLWQMFALGVLLTLNGLARLDSGLVSAMAALVFAATLVRGRRFKALWALVAEPLVVLPAYLALNQWVFGCSTPISGRVKIFWAHEALAHTVGDVLAQSAVGAAKMVARASMDVTGASEVYSYPFLPILMALVGAGLWCAYRQGRLSPLLVVCGVMLVAHAAVVHLALLHLGYSHWYYQPLRIVAAVVVGYLVFIRLPGVPSWAVERARAAAVLAVCLFAAYQGIDRLTQWQNSPSAHRLDAYVLDMVRQIDSSDRLGEGKIGAWNSGVLGYFVERKEVVNLDGLVQSPEFLRDVLRTGAWKQYFREQQIHYLVDYNAQDSTQTYGRKWDRQHLFRDLVPFSQTVQLGSSGPILMLDIRPWLATDDTRSAWLH